MNEWVRKGRFKESRRVMIKIWCRSYCDRKNPHSMRLEDTNQHPSPFITPEREREKTKMRRAGEKKNSSKANQREDWRKAKRWETLPKHEKAKPFSGQRKKPPQEIRKDAIHAPISFVRTNNRDWSVELEQFMLPLPRVDRAISFQPTSKGKDLKSYKFSSANGICRYGYAHFLAQESKRADTTSIMQHQS